MSEKLEKSEKPEKKDYVLIGEPISENAHQAVVVKPSNETIEVGVIEKPVDGKPLNGDLVKLSEREDAPGYDMEYVYRQAPRAPIVGPAKVSSKEYKSGWQNIWGKEDLN